MKYSFHPKAEIEFNISVDYYEECQINLGLEFANEVYKTIQRDEWSLPGVAWT